RVRVLRSEPGVRRVREHLPGLPVELHRGEGCAVHRRRGHVLPPRRRSGVWGELERAWAAVGPAPRRRPALRDRRPRRRVGHVDAETELAWDRPGGPHSGRLYLLFTSEQPQESNDMDIQVQHSEDNGSTWTSPVRVNDDTTTTRSQFNPRIALDPTTGNLAVAWYDCRKDKGNHHFGDTNGIPNDDITIWGSYSTDGGGTFTPNRRISQGVSNDDDAANGVDYGDYEGLAFYGGKYFYAWADNSNS